MNIKLMNTMAFAAALAASSVVAATICVVAGNENAEEPYDTLENAAADIATALSYASTDDEIIVADGTYFVGSTLVVNKKIVLHSQTGRDNTFIEPDGGLGGYSRLMIISNADAVVSGFTFRGHTGADNFAGVAVGIDFPGGSLTDSRITGITSVSSTGANGGAVALSCCARLIRCLVDNNANSSRLRPAAVNVLPFGNTVNYTGHGPYIENCLIVRNVGQGIAIANPAYFSLNVRNCTVVDNAGALGVYHARESTFHNCLFLNTTTMPHREERGFNCVANLNRPTTYLTSCFYTARPEYGTRTDGIDVFVETNCITGLDAMFVDPVNMDYHLRAGARCIDAGAAFAGSGDTDLDGNPRAVGDPTDIGCYEYSPDYVPTTKDIYVAEDGDDANDGLTGETALATIGAAYAQATDGTHIVVGPGTFVLSDTLVIEKTH